MPCCVSRLRGEQSDSGAASRRQRAGRAASGGRAGQRAGVVRGPWRGVVRGPWPVAWRGLWSHHSAESLATACSTASSLKCRCMSLGIVMLTSLAILAHHQRPGNATSQ